MEKKKIVFLYTELATYFLACVNKLAEDASLEIHIVRWPVNAEAPFEFSFGRSIRIYDRTSFTDEGLLTFVNELGPRVIYCSGWKDKAYLKVCRKFRDRSAVILGLDNQWTGSMKQRLAVLLSPFKLLNHFTHCWVPGKLQENYAARLGFKKERILTGFYSCDLEFFQQQFIQNKASRENAFPKRFVFAGRYYEFKGIRDLWQAFIEMQDEDKDGWELWCLGTGDIPPVVHPLIRHFGFVQPAELPGIMKQTGVFVLPSHFEPWGVVVHEFAAAGFPLILSDKVGARLAFVEEGINGYIYEAGNVQALKSCLRKIKSQPLSSLLKMGEQSAEKAKSISPEKWADTIKKLIHP